MNPRHGRRATRAFAAAVAHAALLALATVGAGSAQAAAKLCHEPDPILFGNRPVGIATTLAATLRNCGDAPLTFTGIRADPASGPAFHPTTDCSPGAALAPGAHCTVSVQFAPTVTGQTSGGLWFATGAGLPEALDRHRCRARASDSNRRGSPAARRERQGRVTLRPFNAGAAP